MSEELAGTRRWAEVHARIEEVGRQLVEGGDVAPDVERRLLRERARVLARRPEPPGTQAGREVLEVRVGQLRLAIDTRHVVEVLRPAVVTPLPGAEAPVFALAAWRGRILTVLQVASLMGDPAPPREGRHPLVVLDDGRVTVALLVDSPGTLVQLPEADVRTFPDGHAPRTKRGVTDDALLLLDTDLLLLDLT